MSTATCLFWSTSNVDAFRQIWISRTHRLPSCATIHTFRRWFLTSSAHHNGFVAMLYADDHQMVIQVAPTVSWCSGSSPWSCDGSRSASVDVFTSLGIERYNFCKFRKIFYTHEASVVWKPNKKKSTRNSPKSPNFGAFDLGLERTSEFVQGGKLTGTDLFHATLLLVWLDEAVSMVR